jgi:hypothetical protein
MVRSRAFPVGGWRELKVVFRISRVFFFYLLEYIVLFWHTAFPLALLTLCVCHACLPRPSCRLSSPAAHVKVSRFLRTAVTVQPALRANVDCGEVSGLEDMQRLACSRAGIRATAGPHPNEAVEPRISNRYIRCLPTRPSNHGATPQSDMGWGSVAVRKRSWIGEDP